MFPRTGKTCPSPYDLENVLGLPPDDVTFDFTTTLTLMCDDGWKTHDGEQVQFVKCNASSLWEPSPQACTGQHSPPPPPPPLTRPQTVYTSAFPPPPPALPPQTLCTSAFPPLPALPHKHCTGQHSPPPLTHKPCTRQHSLPPPLPPVWVSILSPLPQTYTGQHSLPSTPCYSKNCTGFFF